jgi:protein SCO1/2
MNRRTFLSVLILILPGAAPAQEGKPAILRGVGITQRLEHQVPLDTVFHNEEGKEVRLGDYFQGKPVILVLAYFRCPKLCNEVLNGLVDAVRSIPSLTAGNQFNIVVISFDARETPAMAAAKRRAYLEAYGRPGVTTGWHILTGPQASIDRVTEAVGFQYAYDTQNDQFAHGSGICILTPQGRIARYFFGIRYSPRDLRLGLVEASQNKIGTPVDQLLLFCFHYDPATGRYTAAVMNFVRLGGLLTLLGLGMFLMRSRWRWRQQKSRLAPLAPVLRGERLG